MEKENIIDVSRYGKNKSKDDAYVWMKTKRMVTDKSWISKLNTRKLKIRKY